MKELEQAICKGLSCINKLYTIYYIADTYKCGVLVNCVAVMVAPDKQQAADLFDNQMKKNRTPYKLKEIRNGKDCVTGTCLTFELRNPYDN
jgi:hypothetical protein